jgi:hypothetical protein
VGESREDVVDGDHLVELVFVQEVLGAEDMDEDDRQALETVRDVISDLISRPG